MSRPNFDDKGYGETERAVFSLAANVLDDHMKKVNTTAVAVLQEAIEGATQTIQGINEEAAQQIAERDEEIQRLHHGDISSETAKQIADRDELIGKLRVERKNETKKLADRDKQIGQLRSQRRSDTQQLIDYEKEIEELRAQLKTTPNAAQQIAERDEEIRRLKNENDARKFMADAVTGRDEYIEKLREQISKHFDTIMELRTQNLALNAVTIGEDSEEVRALKEENKEYVLKEVRLRYQIAQMAGEQGKMAICIKEMEDPYYDDADADLAQLEEGLKLLDESFEESIRKKEEELGRVGEVKREGTELADEVEKILKKEEKREEESRKKKKGKGKSKK